MNFGTAKDEIRQAINIVDLVGSYLDLRRQGSGFVALCPWHDDSKPSLQVNPARNIWKCWVCNIGGDIFSFVMQHDSVDFKTAMKILADRAGIELKQYAPSKPVAPGSPDDKTALLAATAWAEQQFHEYLLRAEGAESARQYIEDRGITLESVEKFRLGYCPENWSWLLDRARGTSHSPAILEAAGLATKKEWGYSDFFAGRVMFPIRDLQSKPIAFGGRVLPNSTLKGGKYVNGRETILFSKREQLYALDIARKESQKRKSKHLTVVEGYTDVILCHQFGVQDVVACLGTALTLNHVPLLRRFADSITLLLDGDDAGQDRTNEILDDFLTVDDFDLRVLTLPDELDPAEFILERGKDEFLRLMQEKAVDALEHQLKAETRDIDVARDTQRAEIAMERILARLARKSLTREIDPKNLQIKQKLARIAREFFVDISDVNSRFFEICSLGKKAQETPRPTVNKSPAALAPPKPEYKLSSITMDEIELLEIFVAHHDYACTALGELGELDLSSEAAKVVFRTYRQLEEAGESLDFNRVLAEIEDPQLQSLLVQLVEVADRKAAKATIDVATRLRQLLQKFHRGHEQRIIREKQAFLQQTEGNEQEKHDVFLEIIEAKRRQQGIIAPTEG